MAYSNLSFNYDLPQGLTPIIWPSEYDKGVWTLDSLLPGESDTMTIVCMPTISNTTVTSKLSYGDETLSTLDIKINPVADLAIDETRVYEDGLLYWIIYVVNNGPDDALNTIVFNLPNYLAYKTDIGEVNGNQWVIGDLKNASEAILILVCEPFDEYSYNFLVLSDIFDPDMSNNNVSGSFSNSQSGSNASIKVSDANATGNPLALLLLTLFMVPFIRFRRA